jgi:hydrogenase-4 component F
VQWLILFERPCDRSLTEALRFAKMNFLLLLLPSLLGALNAILVRPFRAWVGWLNAFLSLLACGAALSFAGLAVSEIDVPVFGPGQFLRADGLSALLMVLVTSVATLTLVLSPGLGRHTRYDTSQLRRYHIFINLFIAAMLLAVSANNVGIMWVALEATTVFSALIIPLRLSKESVEASWKYILIGSVGIALAFAGTVLSYFDFVALSGRVENALNWPVLRATAPLLHPEVMRLSFVFILVGYGTKAGIAPMHTWKPDAYGESPSSLSALMSSALFAVAMYAILRWKIVVDACVGGHFADNLLLALGTLSILIGSFSVVLARNYKRLLAYSGVEHTGLICLGLGLGPLGVFAALLHLINHTAVKSTLFFLVRGIEFKYGSPLIKDVRGMRRVMPWTAGLFAAGMLALTGLPPFGLFVSEFALFRAGFSTKHFWLMGVALALLVVAFVSFINHLNKMLYGPVPEGVDLGELDSRSWVIPLLVPLSALVILGLTIPPHLTTLLNRIMEIVSK